MHINYIYCMTNWVCKNIVVVIWSFNLQLALLNNVEQCVSRFLQNIGAKIMENNQMAPLLRCLYIWNGQRNPKSAFCTILIHFRLVKKPPSIDNLNSYVLFILFFVCFCFHFCLELKFKYDICIY